MILRSVISGDVEGFGKRILRSVRSVFVFLSGGRFFSSAALAACALLCITSCAVHEWPEPSPADVIVNLDFDTQLPQYKVLNEEGTRASHDGRDYDIRYTIAAYRLLQDGSYAEEPFLLKVFSKDEIEELNATFRFSIDEGSYRFYVWTDFVLAGTQSDYFYNTTNFRRISLQGTHEGNNDFRDAFSGSADLKVIRRGSKETPSTVTVQMRRPLAKFEFITTDLQEFITKTIEAMIRKKEAEAAAKAGETKSDGGDNPEDITPIESDTKTDGDTKTGDTKTPVVDLEKYTVVFFYSGYMPNAYNMMEGKPCDSATGVKFSSSISAIDNHDARLGFDYVFVNGEESSVMVTVALYDEEGTQLSISRQIEVPIKRSMLTTVRGSFLMQNTGGGVAIDPGFEDEFNIYIP